VAGISVIGGGEAGIHFIRHFRARDKNTPITLIDKGDYYFQKNNLFSWLAEKSQCEIIKLADFSQEFSVEFIKGKVEKINPARKKIYLKNEKPFEFDRLIVATGAISKNLSIKGSLREGFSYLSEVEPFSIRDSIKVYADVIVFAATSLGVSLAYALSLLSENVKLLANNLDFLGIHKQHVFNIFKEKKVDIYRAVTIEEVIGEVRIKATRISLPKVIASGVVLVDSGFTPNREFIDTSLNAESGFLTNNNGIYILGDAANGALNRQSIFYFNNCRARQQAEQLADYIATGVYPRDL